MKYLIMIILPFRLMSAQLDYEMDDTSIIKFNISNESVNLVSGDSSGGPNADCTNHQAPAGISRLTLDYESMSGFTFGNATSSSFSFLIPRNTYATFPVTAPNSLLLRKNSFEQPTANFTPATYTVSISKCPGDFNVSSSNVGTGRCVVGGQQAGGATTPVIRWTTTTNPSQIDLALKCILDRNETYYLNIIHSTIPPYSQSSCGNSNGCGVLFTELLDN